jgi:Rieske Fe-S protein
MKSTPFPRRTAIKDGCCAALGLSLAPGLVFRQDDRTSIRPAVGDHLIRVGDASLSPLTPADIPLEATPTMAWALDPSDKTVRNGSRLNRVLLLRLRAGQLSRETQTRAADGVVAYTAICTHTGCEVTDWLADQQLLYCPCHFSKFDPKDGARVVDGAAPRALPALPLMLVEGNLVVAEPFTARVGFEPA